MKHQALALSLTLTLALSPTALHAQDQATFDSAYGAFQAAVSAGQMEEAAQRGAEAYAAGQQLFENGSPELARLSLNYGRAVLATGRGPQASEILLSALNQSEAAFGADSKELISVYVSLAEAFATSSGRGSAAEQDQAFSEAARLTALHQGAESQATGITELKAGMTLLDRAQSPLAGPHLERAYSILSSALGRDHALTGQAAFYLAKYALASNNLATAADWLTTAIATFADPARPQNQLEFSTHLLNVQTLEGMGSSEAATASAQAIGRARGNTEAVDLQPLYTVSPRLGADIERKQGSATISFMIDASGRVQQAEVTESTVSEAVEQASLEAISRWRFAPRFEDGQPVAQEASQTLNFGPRQN